MVPVRRALFLLALLVLVGATGDSTTSVTLDFEGLADFVLIGTIAGDIEVEFADWFSGIDFDAGGTGNWANEPSGESAAVAATGDDVINFDPGVLEVSFGYLSANGAGVVTAYSGENGTGEVLDTATATVLGLGCAGDPTGPFGCWGEMTLATASAPIRSLRFVVPGLGFAIDDLTATFECGFAIAPDSGAQGWFGGTATVAVSAHAGCDWTASSDVDWIRILSGASGTGDGTVAYEVGRNTTGERRYGTLTIAEQSYSVVQSEYGCDFMLSPESLSLVTVGGVTTMQVSMDSAACEWEVADLPEWLSLTGATARSGSQTLLFEAWPNLGPEPRRATINVAYRSVDVVQAGTTGAATPTSPADLSLRKRGSSNPRAVLSWTDRSRNEAGFLLTRTEMATARQAPALLGRVATAPVVQRIPADATSFIDRGLKPGTEYCYELRAYNAGGVSTPVRAKGCISTRASGR